MKTTPANKIRELYLAQVPYLQRTGQVWLLDSEYLGIDPELILKEISSKIPVKLKRTGGERWDCDDIAHNAVSEVRKWWLEISGAPAAVAFGYASGMMFRGLSQNHTLNTGVYQNKVFFYDFQIDSWWYANSDNDLAYKVDL